MTLLSDKRHMSVSGLSRGPIYKESYDKLRRNLGGALDKLKKILGFFVNSKVGETRTRDLLIKSSVLATTLSSIAITSV